MEKIHKVKVIDWKEWLRKYSRDNPDVELALVLNGMREYCEDIGNRMARLEGAPPHGDEEEEKEIATWWNKKLKEFAQESWSSGSSDTSEVDIKNQVSGVRVAFQFLVNRAMSDREELKHEALDALEGVIAFVVSGDDEHPICKRGWDADEIGDAMWKVIERAFPRPHDGVADGSAMLRLNLQALFCDLGNEMIRELENGEEREEESEDYKYADEHV